MSRRATLKDIAAEAGVGVATVDHVLNGRAPVMSTTVARVLATAESLNYHAHGLMRRRIEEMAPAKTLDFILQKKGEWFYQSLAKSIGDAAANFREIRGSIVIEFVENLSPDDLARALERMRRRVDAIALVAVDHPKVSAPARPRRTPVSSAGFSQPRTTQRGKRARRHRRPSTTISNARPISTTRPGKKNARPVRSPGD